jgi:TatD DNase family protein
MEPFVGRVRGVFHCFVNEPAAQQRIQAMGSMVSFTGIVTFKSAAVVRESVAATAADQLMLETDCPYLAPMPYRGKRCEPAYVKEISLKVAEVKGISLEELSAATCATAHRFFPKLGR